MEDNQYFDASNLSSFAANVAKESQELIRSLFKEFKDIVFPNAKRDALDYQTICLIEDEFRTQEEMCLSIVNTSFNELCKRLSSWIARFRNSINGYTRMAAVTAGSFIIDIRGHHFTYDVHPLQIPTRLIETFFQESNVRHAELMRKQEQRMTRLISTFQNVAGKLKNDRDEMENNFQKKIDYVLTVELPASHKRIEAIINQNYLQRMGAEHGLN